MEGDGFLNFRLAVALKISIHALRVEGDNSVSAVIGNMEWISIHALRVEGDFYSIITPAK